MRALNPLSHTLFYIVRLKQKGAVKVELCWYGFSLLSMHSAFQTLRKIYTNSFVFSD